MIKINNKSITVVGSVLTGFLIMLAYILKHIVPLSNIYLGSDRTTHVKVVFIFGLLGIIILLLLRYVVKPKWVKYFGYSISSLFMIVLPLLIFINQIQSFRGFSWALETLMIGLLPLLFIYAAFLVFINNKVVNFFLFCIFSFISIYHIVVIIKILPNFGKAFSRIGVIDIMVLIGLIFYGILFAYYSLRRYGEKF